MSKQPPAECSKCGFQELLTISMLPHGDPISFTLCNACGWKRWGRGEELIRLSDVRPMLGKQPPPPPEAPATRIPDRTRRKRARRQTVVRSRAPSSGRPYGKGDAA